MRSGASDSFATGSGTEALHEVLGMIEEYRRMRDPHLALEQARILRAGVGALIAELTEDVEEAKTARD